MVVVTGASFGIGHAVARQLAQRGLPVLAVARTSQPLAQLSDEFPQLQFVVADVATQQGLDAIVSATNSHELISGLVHCAGSLVRPEPFFEVDTERLIEHFRVHVAAPIQLTQRLLQQGRVKRMLWIDSYSAAEPRDGWSAYSIVKAAAQMTARCAQKELQETLTVRIFPGAVQTAVVDTVIASEAKASQTFAALVAAGKVRRTSSFTRPVSANAGLTDLLPVPAQAQGWEAASTAVASGVDAGADDAGDTRSIN